MNRLISSTDKSTTGARGLAGTLRKTLRSDA